MAKKKTNEVHYLTINDEFTGQRLDNFLVTYLKRIPKTHIYRILRKGEVRVNKKRAQPSYRLQANDQIRIPPLFVDEAPPQAVPSKSLVQLLQNRILYEDKSLIIINKPAGLAVHGGSSVPIGVIEALRNCFPKLPHLELAHRLDLDTSGCLILAKKRSILREVHELLRQGSVLKIYWALTKGHWQDDKLIVNVPLLKNYLSSGERIVKVNQEGKASLTHFEILNIYEQATLVAATLHTGRTHQIRVHAQYRGHPIAGDPKYGDKEFNQLMRKLGLKRMFLHSHHVEFTLPSTGERIVVTAPLDEELEACLSRLKNSSSR